MSFDAVVVGAGLSGLVAALRMSEGGLRVAVVAKGVGAVNLSPVTIDVLGYAPGEVERRVEDPGQALTELTSQRPDHPYARVGRGGVEEAVSWFKAQMPGYGYVGDLSANFLLPTAVGVPKPAAVVPETMAAGDLRRGARFVLVGFASLKDFYPEYLADNLRAGDLGVQARGMVIDPPVGGEADVGTLGYARHFADTEFRKAVISRLEGRIEAGESVGFPAVLGFDDAGHIHKELQDMLGASVFEVPTLPPSVAGIRVFRALKSALRRRGCRVVIGTPVIGVEVSGNRVQAVVTESAARPLAVAGKWFVLASGGIASGGVEMDSHGVVRETVFDLPVVGVPDRGSGRFLPGYLAEHPMGRAGVAVDAGLRPVDGDGNRIFENLLVAGATLAGAQPWREKSGDGISLATGHRAGEIVVGEAS